MSLPFLSDDELQRIKEDYPLSSGCPTCRGAGKYRLYGEELECNCQQQKRLSRAYYSANIGVRFQTATWEDFTSSDRDKLFPVFQSYVDSFEWNYRYGLGWTLSGLQGTGKTMILTLVLKDLIKLGHDCFFVEAGDLKDIYGQRSDPKKRETLDKRLRKAEILGIDDLCSGKTFAQIQFIEEALESVIRFRYNNSLPTLITTNMTPEKQIEVYPRVLSVLSGMNEWYETRSKIDARSSLFSKKLIELQLNKETLPIV